jgi:hypothetical protein
MARLPRHISKFVRAKSLAMFRKDLLPMIRQIVAVHIRRLARKQTTGSISGPPLRFDYDALRDGVEALLEVPAAAGATRASKVERLEAELKAWKRRRTIARRKVAQLQRSVRYHRKATASKGCGE